MPRPPGSSMETDSGQCVVGNGINAESSSSASLCPNGTNFNGTLHDYQRTSSTPCNLETGYAGSLRSPNAHQGANLKDRQDVNADLVDTRSSSSTSSCPVGCSSGGSSCGVQHIGGVPCDSETINSGSFVSSNAHQGASIQAHQNANTDRIRTGSSSSPNSCPNGHPSDKANTRSSSSSSSCPSGFVVGKTSCDSLCVSGAQGNSDTTCLGSFGLSSTHQDANVEARQGININVANTNSSSSSSPCPSTGSSGDFSRDAQHVEGVTRDVNCDVDTLSTDFQPLEKGDVMEACAPKKVSSRTPPS